MRRLGREQRGFPSVDRVLSELDEYSNFLKRREISNTDLTRPHTLATEKSVQVYDKLHDRRIGTVWPTAINSNALVPTFEGSLTGGESEVLPIKVTDSKITDLDRTNIDRVYHRTLIEDSIRDRDAVDKQIRETPGFNESLSRVREHLRSPQMQNALADYHRNFPEDKPGGRFVLVEHHRSNGLSVSSYSDSDRDYLDLQTQNWAEMSPDTWFPDGPY